MQVRTNHLVFAGLLAVWAVIVLRSFLGVKDAGDFEVTASQAQVDTFARAELAKLQGQSIRENTEICSILFEDSQGRLGSTSAKPGNHDSCDIRYFDLPGMAPVATIHTHAGFDADYDSEVPSMQDYLSDMQSGMDGYISTPGGRFWRIDSDTGQVDQLCGAGCLEQDPAYARCRGEPPAQRYDAETLQARARGPLSSC